MRHAIVPIHLIEDARAAAEPARQVADAPPDPHPTPTRPPTPHLGGSPPCSAAPGP
jgi:hypothetical protein